MIARLENFKAKDISFKVNEKGRQRVLEKKQKNVHAFIVARSFEETTGIIDINKLSRITYNPYIHSSFVNENQSIFSAEEVFFLNGKCYVQL